MKLGLNAIILSLNIWKHGKDHWTMLEMSFDALSTKSAFPLQKWS